jgi:hypothetical protein
MRSARMTMLLVTVVAAMPGAAKAQLKASVGDWPGWMGPDRTGVSQETGLLKQWPKRDRAISRRGQDFPDEQYATKPCCCVMM